MLLLAEIVVPMPAYSTLPAATTAVLLLRLLLLLRLHITTKKKVFVQAQRTVTYIHGHTWRPTTISVRDHVVSPGGAISFLLNPTFTWPPSTTISIPVVPTKLSTTTLLVPAQHVDAHTYIFLVWRPRTHNGSILRFRTLPL